MATLDPLTSARRWAELYAEERVTPAYVYRLPDGELMIGFTLREASWIDGAALELVEVVQPALGSGAFLANPPFGASL